MKKMLRVFPLALVLALGMAFLVVPSAMAQQVPGQPGDQAGATDAELLAEVLAALPPGVTLETATDDQIAAAVQSVITTRSAAAPGAPTPDVGSVASQVVSVVSVTLDSVGRSASANTVTTQVVNALPPQVRSQVQQQVQTSRANPTPSQVAATAVVIAQIQPAAGQQQQQLVIIPQQQQLGQTVFQENPNQVSPR